jgi:hypothetical protein
MMVHYYVILPYLDMISLVNVKGFYGYNFDISWFDQILLVRFPHLGIILNNVQLKSIHCWSLGAYLKEASGRNCHLWVLEFGYEVCFGGKSYIIMPKDLKLH